MSDSELRFRRTVKIDNKEESVDLLTLALKKDAEYDKVSAIAFRNYLLLGNFPWLPRPRILHETDSCPVPSIFII